MGRISGIRHCAAQLPPLSFAARQTAGRYRGVAQSGRALRSGRRGRRFESCLPDHLFISKGRPKGWPFCVESPGTRSADEVIVRRQRRPTRPRPSSHGISAELREQARAKSIRRSICAQAALIPADPGLGQPTDCRSSDAHSVRQQFQLVFAACFEIRGSQ